MAEDPSEPANDVASLIEDLAPYQGAVVVGDVTVDAIETELNGNEISVPLDPAETISVGSVNQGDDDPQVTLSLPDEVNLEAATMADDGTVYYSAADGDTDVAVQVLDDGSVRLETVLNTSDAPSEFAYSLGDSFCLSLNPDGSVDVSLVADAGSVSVGKFTAPAPAVAICGAAVALYFTSLSNSVQDAARTNQCWHVDWLWGVNIPWRWGKVYCSGF